MVEMRRGVEDCGQEWLRKTGGRSKQEGEVHEGRLERGCG